MVKNKKSGTIGRFVFYLPNGQVLVSLGRRRALVEWQAANVVDFFTGEPIGYSHGYNI